MSEWIYMTNVLTDEMVPDDAIGFIYIIQNNTNGMKYVGKKLLTRAATKQVNGKKKKIRKESDWRDYWSSSPWLKEIIEAEGKENFSRKIIMFCTTKGELNYAEEKLQYQWGVLEHEGWYNSNIRSRIFKKSVIKYDLKRLKMVGMIHGDVCVKPAFQ